MSEIHKFLFDGLPLKGAIVRLTDSWQEVLQRRAANTQTGSWSQPVAELLGQMLAAGCLMQSGIKFNGALVLQMQSAGPVQLAVAEVQNDFALRATATVQADADLAAGANLGQMLPQGQCAVTLDPRDRLPGQQPYQGVVALKNAAGEDLPTLAQALASYMLYSEQLDTYFVLAADAHTAAGIMLQRIPIKGEGNLEGSGALSEEEMQEACARIASHTMSLKAEELLNLDVDTILHRLYWEEKLLRFRPSEDEQAPHFACTCSRARVAAMLQNLGAGEAQEILAEQGQIEIGCDFCGAQYRFDAVDVGALFQATTQDWSHTRQ